MSSKGPRKKSGYKKKYQENPPKRNNLYNEGDLFRANWLNAGLNEARGLRKLRKIEVMIKSSRW